MTRNDKKWLVAGLVPGLAIAAAVYGVLVPEHPAPPPTVAEAAPPASDETESPSGVALTVDELKAIGVETVEVGRGTLRREILTSGKVSEPETGIGTISSRLSGRIDELFLNITGEPVSRGQAVALIYSPEIVTSAEEYKLAIENRQRLKASKESQAIEEADELVRASRRRLELRGLTFEQIQSIVSSAESAIQITTYSPVSGIVTQRNVAEGQYVKEGDILYTVTDLSSVWVEADIFESDIPLVRNGQTARITAPSLNTTLRGTVSFLQPAIDPQTRTMKARIQTANPQMRLRPGMYVQVSLETRGAADAVLVPRSAVLETGKEKVVYVAKDEGIFEKRSIETSFADEGHYAVTRGIDAGERVVTHGSFLIDSQSRLTGSMAGIFGGSKGFAEQAQATVTFRFDPAAPRGGDDAMLHATVIGPDSKPIPDAQVQLTLLMPAMPAMGMGEMRSVFKLTWNGSEYVGSGTIPMAGPWNIAVEARRDGQLLGVYRSRFDAK